jgi:hypothetical protein
VSDGIPLPIYTHTHACIHHIPPSSYSNTHTHTHTHILTHTHTHTQSVIQWFADRADLIIIMFDAHKLDISDELRVVMDALRIHQDKIRILLNKVCVCVCVCDFSERRMTREGAEAITGGTSTYT